MSKVAYDYMEEYIRGLISENEGILKDLEDYAKENAVPIVHKEVANFFRVYDKCKKNLKKILELGTAIGYSSIFMSLSSNGESNITTIERDDKMIEIARSNIEKHGFKDKIKIIHGDCLEILKDLDDKYDMIFMDAGKGHYNEFLPYCLKLLNKDGIIIADNVLFRGMVANDELVIRRKITIVKRMRKYMNMISDKENFITSIIPMGDGIAITKRRNEDA
ncbi:O-methyltransferase [Clostridium botulinum]|nr:O-methyltransferase [Clostridium botulinum]MBO0550606.1 O-methyltransferase [Clostridium botulinum]